MTSSMATGERKWASARRGGMTVLGKVAVPKPINLPSQRLENRGMDPSVEIVPKGTLSWGSRPSSAGSNAWGNSSLSPRTDGSISSPSHLAGRPSSGGGTRPSTAGSEKAYDSNVNAWCSNSRPSSASGVLASSNSSLTSLRPRSAETRPGSSQLSRFAESTGESTVPRASNSTSERMGIAAPGNDGFSLSSGDFPTLGSEKDESRKSSEPLDCVAQGRPGSSSDQVKAMADNVGVAHGDEISRNADFKGNSWRRDGPPYNEDGPRPGMERWHGEPHPYPNHNMAPPHYESWRGAPPVNPHGGVWYRGPPGPPPYGVPGAPGGFPMEPFAYYGPQVPPPRLANSQSMPPGGGPHGPHPKNGDMYRPPMPDSYMRPGMPIRPGFYPSPVPYEGYYGPPMGFCNPNERDLPFMGMPPGPPPVFNRPVNQNGPDPNNSRPRSREHRGPDQVEPGLNDPRGNYKVLMKQNDGWNHNDEERWSHRANASASNREKGILSKSSVQENTWGCDHKKDKDMHYGKSAPAKEVPSQKFDTKFGSIDPASVRIRGSNANETDTPLVMENAASPRDHSLIQKIEGLNAKARASGGKQDGFHREQPHDKVHIGNANINRTLIDTNSDVILERRHPTGIAPVSHDMNTATIEKSRESAVSSVTATASRPMRGVQSRGGHQGRGRFNGHEADGRVKNSESHTVVSAAVSGSTTIDEVKDLSAEVLKSDAERKGDRAPVLSTFDDTQRAKMREIARQRAIQLQKEEEERTREQKAKALAKLEELNRRSANQGIENQTQNLESVPPSSSASEKQEISRKQPEPSLDANEAAESSSVSSNIVQTSERTRNDTVDSAVSHSLVDPVTKKHAERDPVLPQNQPETSDLKVNDAIAHRTAPRVREASKQKRVAHKQRQNVPSERNPMQESTSAIKADVLKVEESIGSAEDTSGNLAVSVSGTEPKESPLASDSLVHQKKTSNRGGKNKHKVEESSNTIPSSEATPKDSRTAQDSPEGAQEVASGLNINPSPIHSSTDATDAVISSDHSSLSREDSHGRQNNSWKPQHSRKPKSSQSSRVSEKSSGSDAVVWAPVRSNNKVDVAEQTSQKAAAEPSVPSETVSNAPPNSSKTKRAEMERYVPKPVAKELAQQGSVHKQSSSSPPDQKRTDGAAVKSKNPQNPETFDQAVKALGSAPESKHVDGRHKQLKAQGSWRQRVSTQSTLVQSSQENSSSTANLSNNVQPSDGSKQIVKSDESVVVGTHSRPDEHTDEGTQLQASMCDGWNIVNDPSSTSAASSGMKVHSPSGRGKKNPSKGYNRGSGYNQNFDRKDSHAGITDSHYPSLETSQAERIPSSKYNRAVGDRSTSQWQPKSQSIQGSKPHGGPGLAGEDDEGSKRETGPNGEAPKSEASKDVDVGHPSTENEEFKQDKRANLVKSHHNQGASIEVESASSGATIDGLNEHRPSSGHRKNTNYGTRYNRGHDSRGDWSSTPQENKQQHNSSANRERQRQNSHYEYQPVGPYNNNNRRWNEAGSQKDNQTGGQRFRERGNNYSRRGRGNYYGRQSGNPSEAGY